MNPIVTLAICFGLTLAICLMVCWLLRAAVDLRIERDRQKEVEDTSAKEALAEAVALLNRVNIKPETDTHHTIGNLKYSFSSMCFFCSRHDKHADDCRLALFLNKVEQ